MYIIHKYGLSSKTTLKMGLGQLRGPSGVTGIPLHCPNQKSIVASGGLDVCDDAHRLGVMKKVKGPAQAKLGRSTLLYGSLS